MRYYMQIVYVENKRQMKIYLSLFNHIYNGNIYVRNSNDYIIRQLYKGKTSFCEGKYIRLVYVCEQDMPVAQCVFIHTDKLQGVLQVSFFEALPDKQHAVDLLIFEAVNICKNKGLSKIVVGLNGHVNYGLGLLVDSFDKPQVFGSQYNMPYYKEYFRKHNMREVNLSSYYWDMKLEKLDRFNKIYEKLSLRYSFRIFDKRNFEHDAKLYTDLNLACFNGHRYYYPSSYDEDKVLLKELFMLTTYNSLVFVYDGNKPIGFILWYPDFNEVIKPCGSINLLSYFRIKFFSSRIKRVKVAEIGVIPEYHKKGISILLLKYAAILADGRYDYGESSWILDENRQSKKMTEAIADLEYKHYSVFEMDVDHDSNSLQ